MYTTENIIDCSSNCCNNSCFQLLFVQCNIRSKANKVCEGYSATPWSYYP